MDERSGEELWAASRQGDGDAFGVVFDRHHPRVHRHAVRLLTSRSDAEDVTAGAFLELWRRREDVRVVNGSVLPWLLVTTSNLSRNVHRGTRRYRELLQRLPHQVPAEDVTADLLSGPFGGDEDLSAALRALRPGDLRLLTIVVLEDFPLADAALVLGITPGAAKTRLHRARVRLRAALSDHPAARKLTSTPEGHHS